MTPQDTPPPLDLDLFRKWFANGETHSDRLGLLLVAEIEHLRGVDQGNGVREATPAEDLLADCERRIITAACQWHLGHINDDAPTEALHDAVMRYLNAPSPAETPAAGAALPEWLGEKIEKLILQYIWKPFTPGYTEAQETAKRLAAHILAYIPTPPKAEGLPEGRRERVAEEIRDIVRTHKVAEQMPPWSGCGPMIKGRWMLVADRILNLLPPPAVPAPAQGDTRLAWDMADAVFQILQYYDEHKIEARTPGGQNRFEQLREVYYRARPPEGQEGSKPSAAPLENGSGDEAN